MFKNFYFRKKKNLYSLVFLQIKKKATAESRGFNEKNNIVREQGKEGLYLFG